MSSIVKGGREIQATRAGEILRDGVVYPVSEGWDFEKGVQDAISAGLNEVIGERWLFVSEGRVFIGARATAALDVKAIKARAYQGGIDAARTDAARVALNDPEFKCFVEALEVGVERVAEVAREAGFQVSTSEVQQEARWA